MKKKGENDMEKLAREIANEIKFQGSDDGRHDLRYLVIETIDFLYPRIEDAGFDWSDLDDLCHEVYQLM